MGSLAKNPPILYLIATIDQGGENGARVAEICAAAREIAPAAQLTILVQLRDKNASAAQLTKAASAWIKALMAHKAFVLINERADVAICAGAPGVHLGAGSIPVPEARRLLPEGFVGWSAHSPEEAARAAAEGADFVTLSPIWASPGKGEPLGVQALSSADCGSVPMLALGGIGPEEACAALRAGASGVAVIRSVFHAPDPSGAARDMARALTQAEE